MLSPKRYCEGVSFGLTIEKLLVIAVIALFLIGPDRLPAYSAQFGRLIRNLRDMASGAKDRMRDELGPDFDDVDWQKLDPRQYDPRRIIREALQEPSATSTPDSTEQKVVVESAYSQRKRRLDGKWAPYDADVT